MKKWHLQEAKSKFSEVIKEAVSRGPQEVSVRGKPTVVILSVIQYRKLIQQEPSLVHFLRNSPLMNSGIILDRERSLCRPIEL